jgi:hypothetical protein
MPGRKVQVFVGGCRCGAIQYAVQAETLPPVYCCHCRDCQTWTGSAFSQQAIVTENTFTVEGDVALFELTSPSGKISQQYACATCFTRLYNRSSGRPGKIILRAGTLECSDTLDVVAHIWTKRKQPWLTLPETCPAWEESAPPEIFAELMGKGDH